MDHAELVMILAFVTLSAVVVILSTRLASTNKLLASCWLRSMEHAMGWSEDQRAHMRSRLESEQNEILLNAQRESAAMRNGRYVSPPEPDPDNLDIRVNTGIVTD